MRPVVAISRERKSPKQTETHHPGLRRATSVRGSVKLGANLGSEKTAIGPDYLV